MTDLLTVVGICVATWRLTRLLTCDWFLPVRKVRCAIARRAKREWQRVLVTCPWCVSVWFAAGVTLLTDLFASVPVPGLIWPMAAGFAGYASMLDQYLRTCAECRDLRRRDS